jgi:hypothetical protein
MRRLICDIKGGSHGYCRVCVVQKPVLFVPIRLLLKTIQTVNAKNLVANMLL